jgi:hypothetical protein
MAFPGYQRGKKLAKLEPLAGRQGERMSRLKDFALGMVLTALGVAAFFQVFHVDPVLRFASVGAVCAICILAAAVFFVFAFGGDRR